MTPSKHYYSKKKEAGVLLKHLWTDYDDDDDDDDDDDVDDVDDVDDDDVLKIFGGMMFDSRIC